MPLQEATADIPESLPVRQESVVPEANEDVETVLPMEIDDLDDDSAFG